MVVQELGQVVPPSSQLSRRRRIGVLLICSMSLLIVGLDVTIVNVALPSIGRDFGASVSGLQWTVDSYTLVLASLLMLSGSTADRLGRKRTFITGLLVFSAGSLLCSLAPSLTLLVVFRMVQAVGGSMLNPVAMSIITNTFTDPRERAQAVGVWAAVVGVSMALGPVIGGILVDSVGWRSIFWINLPVGLAAVLLTLRFIPESRAPKPRRVDGIGQVLVVVFLASLTYGIIEAPDHGWGSPVILAAFALAAAALVGLISWEGRRDEPLIDLRFFRSVPFSGAAVIAVAAFATLGGFLFLNTLYLQEVRGFSPLRAGLYTLPMAAMTMLLPPISGRIVGTQGIPDSVAHRRYRPHGKLHHAELPRGHHLHRLAVRLLCGVRNRLRVRQRPHHQRRRLRHAPGPGRSGCGHRHHLPPGGGDPGRGRGGGPPCLFVGRVPQRRRGHRHSRRLVGAGRLRCRGARARSDRDYRLGPPDGRADRPGSEP